MSSWPQEETGMGKFHSNAFRIRGKKISGIDSDAANFQLVRPQRPHRCCHNERRNAAAIRGDGSESTLTRLSHQGRQLCNMLFECAINRKRAICTIGFGKKCQQLLPVHISHSRRAPNVMKFAAHVNTGLNFLIMNNEPERPNSATYRNKNTCPAHVSFYKILKAVLRSLLQTSLFRRDLFDEQNSLLGNFMETHRFHFTVHQRPEHQIRAH